MVPNSEVTSCVYPRNPLVVVGASIPGRGHTETDVFIRRCFVDHPQACTWNGAEWYCTVCRRLVEFILHRRVHEPFTFRVAKRDTFYDTAIALYRDSLLMQWPHARLRAHVNRWNEWKPGADYSGQRKRRGCE
jgi:hypothetical protein